MILQASLIGGWEKLELWGHTHLALLGVLTMVCVLEVILLKMTTSTGLLTRLHYHDPDYDDSGEYEEDIYYEDLSTNYDLWTRRRTHYRHRQQDPEQQLMQQRQTRYSYNSYNHYGDENNQFINNNYYSTPTDVFRFVY